MKRVAAIGWMLACTTACGGRASEHRTGSADIGGGGTSGGNDSAAGMATGGSSSGAGAGAAAVGGHGGAPSGGARACDFALYADAPEHVINVAIINKSSRPIYFGPMQIGPEPVIEVTDSAAMPVPDFGSCPAECAILLQSAEENAGTLKTCVAVPAPATTRLEPGASFESAWGATYFMKHVLSPACQALVGSNATDCEQALPAPAGDYTVTAHAGTEVQCNGTPCDQWQSCDAGRCWTTGALVTGSVLTATTTFTIDADQMLVGAGGAPDSAGVEVDFED